MEPYIPCESEQEEKNGGHTVAVQILQRQPSPDSQIKMRQKRAKAYRKLMSLYALSFGFHQPYQVLGKFATNLWIGSPFISWQSTLKCVNPQSISSSTSSSSSVLSFKVSSSQVRVPPPAHSVTLSRFNSDYTVLNPRAISCRQILSGCGGPRQDL
jgi:hypothetical protein